MAKKYHVKGYEFDSYVEAAEAERELQAVQYLSQKTRQSSPETACKIYRKLTEQEIFHTPVGLDYVKSLENELIQKNLIEAVEKNPESEEQAQTKTAEADSTKELRKTREQLRKLKDRLNTSLILNGILIIAIAAMIYIASTSSNINILNYETALQDKYSSWAEDLKDKEKQLKEREAVIEQKEEELKIQTEMQEK